MQLIKTETDQEVLHSESSKYELQMHLGMRVTVARSKTMLKMKSVESPVQVQLGICHEQEVKVHCKVRHKE